LAIQSVNALSFRLSGSLVASDKFEHAFDIFINRILRNREGGLFDHA